MQEQRNKKQINSEIERGFILKNYQINLKKELNSIYPTLEHLQGVNPNGEHISFTNHI